MSAASKGAVSFFGLCQILTASPVKCPNLVSVIRSFNSNSLGHGLRLSPFISFGYLNHTDRLLRKRDTPNPQRDDISPCGLKLNCKHDCTIRNRYRLSQSRAGQGCLQCKPKFHNGGCLLSDYSKANHLNLEQTQFDL